MSNRAPSDSHLIFFLTFEVDGRIEVGFRGVKTDFTWLWSLLDD